MRPAPLLSRALLLLFLASLGGGASFYLLVTVVPLYASQSWGGVGAGLATGALMLSTVVAELQLTARRCGGRIRVRNASSELHEVLALAGLSEVLGVLCPPLRLEASWQTEHREEAGGVEEKRDPGDPIA